MQIDIEQFRGIFFDESAELLGDMEAALLDLETAPGDKELLNRIFRAAHSIKGSSATFGLDDVARFTHSLEGLLDKMREGEIRADRGLTDLLLRSADVLRALVAAAQNKSPKPEGADALVQEIDRVLARHAGAQVSAAAAPAAAVAAPVIARRVLRVRFLPNPDLLRQGMNPLLLLRELAALGELASVQADTSRLPPLEQLDPTTSYLGFSLELSTERSLDEVRRVFEFVEDGSVVELAERSPAKEQVEEREVEQPSAAQDRAAAKSTIESNSIRVATERVDRLMNLVGELVIAQSMIVQVINHFSIDKLPRLYEAITEMERNTRELQERVMAVRMVPVGSVFARFPRMVRDLAVSFGKKINLVTTGEDTELDKSVIERIADPLTHLVRNSVDHGVERPEARLKAGKPEVGTIRLMAFHQGGNVIVEVSDDGRGIDLERVRAKGVEKGLIAPDDVLSEEETIGLIFAPGFSTSEVVSSISGRGVGMDVVKRNIEALGGSISIENRPGQGSSFRIKLPLTLAILDGQCLGVAGQIYVLPLLSIVESLHPRKEQIKTMLGQGEVVVIRGESLPLVRLHRLFKLESSKSESRPLVVIVENVGGKVGLLVDELLGQSQVVIKSLESNYQRVDGLAGATIMGDGRVAFILDIQGLMRLAGIDGKRGHQAAEREPEARPG